MKLNIKLTGIIAILLISTTTAIYAQQSIISINGVVASYEVEPVTIDGYTYIALNELNKSNYINIVYDDKDKSITASNTTNLTESETEENKINTIKMFINNNKAEINSEKTSIPIAPKYYQGYIVVPLRTVTEALGFNVTWNENLKTIQITTNEKNNSNLNKNNNLTVIDKTKEDAKITEVNAMVMRYDEALKQAISSNSSIKSLDDSLALLSETRKSTIENYENSASMGMDLAAINSLRSLLNIDVTTSNVPLNKQIIEKTTEYTLINILSSIESYKLDILQANANIKLANQNLKDVTLKESLGVASKNQVIDAKNNYNLLIGKLETTKISLDSQKNVLNNLLGVSLIYDITVDHAVDAIPADNFLGNRDISHYASSQLDIDPTIIMLQKKVNQAKYALDTVVSSVDESKLQKQNDYEEASRNLVNAKNKMTLSIYKAYNNLKALEQAQALSQINLEKAKTDYKNLLVNYQIGSITKTELNNGENAILSSEIQIEKNNYNYQNLIYGLKYPFLL